MTARVPKSAVPTPPQQRPAGLARREALPEHRHRVVDRAAQAGLARLTSGVSPHAVIEAWTD